MNCSMSRLSTFADTDPDLELRIRVFLASLGWQSLKQLHVRVSEGAVFLHGRVASFYERQLAINACQRVAGVYQLNEAIEVDS